MKLFKTFNDAWLHTLLQLLDGNASGSRDGAAFELDPGFGFTITSNERWLKNETRGLSAHYACGELLWYLSASNSGEQIKAYAPSYERFLTKGVALGAYGPRIVPSIFNIIHELRKNPNSRRAVLPIFNAIDWHEIRSDGPDVPCTCSLQFFVCNDAVELVVYMRSNDVWMGMPYDVFCFSAIQQLIADSLELPVGAYTHMVGSCHLYERNLEKAKLAVADDSEFDETGFFDAAPPVDGLFHNRISQIERNIRTGNAHHSEPFWTAALYGEKSVLTSSLAVVQHKFATKLFGDEYMFDKERLPQFLQDAKEFSC